MINRIAGQMFSFMMPLMDTPDDGGGGGNAGGGDGKPGANGDGVKPGDKKPEDVGGDRSKPDAGGNKKPDEDPRTAGILKDLQGERTRRQTTETKLTELQTQLELATKRIQALAGVNPQSAQDADEEAIKLALQKRFPVLAKLDDKALDKLLGLAERADGLEESNLRQWTNHANKMIDGVIAGVSKEMGGELTDRQKTRLQQSYLHEAQTNAEFLKRHEMGDPKLIDEFVKDFIADWFEPARRKVTQLEQQRQHRVPGARDRSVPGAGGKKVDLLDDKAFGDAVVASYRGHGGDFGD